MVKHWTCTNCKATQDYSIGEVLPQFCVCGSKGCKVKYITRSDFREESKRGISGLMVEHPRYSASGAVLDEDLAEVKRRNPYREWKKFGNSWRPLIKNRADKIKFMREAGAYEY